MTRKYCVCPGTYKLYCVENFISYILQRNKTYLRKGIEIQVLTFLWPRNSIVFFFSLPLLFILTLLKSFLTL